jgi:hypothetical protein
MTNHTAEEGSMLRLILALVMLVLALPVVGSGESPPLGCAAHSLTLETGGAERLHKEH